MKIDSKTRRKLRIGLGSRTQRRNGTKSHGFELPKHQLARAIKAHLKETAQCVNAQLLAWIKDDIHRQMEILENETS